MDSICSNNSRNTVKVNMMEERLEKIIHELKQMGEVQNHFRYNIERLDEIEKRQSKRIEEFEKEMDEYITK